MAAPNAPKPTVAQSGEPAGTVKEDRGNPSPADPGGQWLWHSCVIGDFILPVDPTDGSVTVEAESGAKKDKKKAAGKSKSKTTKQGKEDVKIKIHCEFTARSWRDGDPWGKGWESVLAELDPNHPEGGGGPYAFSHPDTNRRGVKSVMVDKIGKTEWKGHICKVEIDVTEWTKPDAPAGDGSKTPNGKVDGSKWMAKKNPGDLPATPAGPPLQPVNNTPPKPANK